MQVTSVNCITLDELRAELRAFASSEALRNELIHQSQQLQTNIRKDFQKMFRVSDGGEQIAADSGLRDVGNITHVRTDPVHSVVSLPLPGSVMTPSETRNKVKTVCVRYEGDAEDMEHKGNDDDGPGRAESRKTNKSARSEPSSEPARYTLRAAATTKSLGTELSTEHQVRQTESKPSRVKTGTITSTRTQPKSRLTIHTGSQNLLGKYGDWRAKAILVCGSAYFDYVTAILILLNGILVGVQTEYMAVKDLKDPPIAFEVVEYLFCVAFTIELALRLYAYRSRFFTSSGKAWNIFDFIIVSVQLVEIFMTILASGLGSFNFNILRILRLLRIVRLARVLRLFAELRTIVQSIVGSLKPLFWTAVLLFMIIYVLGICLTQAVHTRRMEMKEDNEPIPEAIEKFWSTLTRSVFSLFEAITGGVDWDDVCRPLIETVGVVVGLLFCIYILFTVLAMLNVVTGVFIDSVMSNATKAKEQATISHVQHLFHRLDMQHQGEITWDMFETCLQEKEMQEFFKTIDVDIEQAKSLFELLDLDESGSVDINEFMDGCLRIWAPAKGLDLRMILRDVNRLAAMIKYMGTHPHPQRTSGVSVNGHSASPNDEEGEDDPEKTSPLNTNLFNDIRRSAALNHVTMLDNDDD
jgi:voltage-gated sodium channel